MSAQDGEGGYDLAFVYVNRQTMNLIGLTQYNQDGTISDHRIYTTFRSANIKDNDSTVIEYTLNYNGYGNMNGTIALGPKHTPVFDSDFCCDNCKNAVLSICPEYDVLLMDLKEQTIYDICRYDYDFTFRNYHLITSRNNDKTISISIVDTNLQD